jgi:hypothetical protein
VSVRLVIISAVVALGMVGGFVAVADIQCTKADHARVELKTLRDAIALYRTVTREAPARLEDLVDGWERPFLYEVPADPWQRRYVYLRPGCLLSLGPDGVLGTADDITLDCAPELINQHVLLEAGLAGELGRRDVYGRKIRFVKSGAIVLAWSYGADGREDTKDDQVARIAASAVRRN